MQRKEVVVFRYHSVCRECVKVLWAFLPFLQKFLICTSIGRGHPWARLGDSFCFSLLCIGWVWPLYLINSFTFLPG